jgi:hypothetical protein
MSSASIDCSGEKQQRHEEDEEEEDGGGGAGARAVAAADHGKRENGGKNLARMINRVEAIGVSALEVEGWVMERLFK